MLKCILFYVTVTEYNDMWLILDFTVWLLHCYHITVTLVIIVIFSVYIILY